MSEKSAPLDRARATQLAKKLPKTELHLHIEGTLEAQMMFDLAKRNNVELPYGSVDEILKAYEFENLQSFLDLYYAGTAVLVHEQDFYDLTFAYLKRAHEDNVVHTEIFFDPQSHTDRGIDFSIFMGGMRRAIQDAKSKFGITCYMIMCFLRHLSEEDAFKTLQMAKPYLAEIKGVGLDSSEVGHPPEKFQKVFAEAVNMGLIPVAHAGEEGPPEYIHQALDLLKVKRIDHGVRCLEDQDLVTRLAEEQIPLTVCPFSNVKLCVFEKLDHHNLKQLLDANLCATINSDDPSYFGGYLNENYIETALAQGLNQSEFVTLIRNSFTASFLPEASKQQRIEEIEKLSQCV